MKTSLFWKKIKEINFILKNDLTECFNFELKCQIYFFNQCYSIIHLAWKHIAYWQTQSVSNRIGWNWNRSRLKITKRSISALVTNLW